MQLQNKIAVVTGVSKGIGRAIVEQLLSKGCIVAGLGKNEPDFKHENFHFFSTDVRVLKSVEESFEVFRKLLDETIHILVNNAGLGYFGNFDEMPPEQFYEMYEVNVYGIYHVCRQVIPVMKKSGYGHIVNISSIAGLEGMAQIGGYAGSKHAVKGITDSLFRELRDSGIKVTGVYPGSVQTDFFNNSPGIKAHDKMMQAVDVASQIVHALETPDNFNVNDIVFRPLRVK